MFKPLRFLALLSVLILTSCGESTTCAVDEDCFKGEYCSSGTCIEGVRPDQTIDQGQLDSHTPARDMEDAKGSDLEEIDAGACQVDPFDAPPCENQASDTEYFDARTVGCQNDGWEGLDKTISSTLCVRETFHRYRQNYVECDVESFVVEVIFTPKVECNPEVYSFNIWFAGQNCDEADSSDSIECTTLEDGSRRVQVIVPPGRNVSGGSIKIEALQPDTIQLDYDLRVVIRK